MTILGAWLASRAWRNCFSFAGKVVLISGGSRGLGLILARQISNEGGKVALLARDADELEPFSGRTLEKIARDAPGI